MLTGKSALVAGWTSDIGRSAAFLVCDGAASITGAAPPVAGGRIAH